MATQQHANGSTDDNGWLTRAEAAEYAKVSIRTVDRAIQDGSLESCKRNHTRRIRRIWIDMWLGGTVALITGLLILFALCALGVHEAQHLLRLVGCPHA